MTPQESNPPLAPDAAVGEPEPVVHAKWKILGLSALCGMSALSATGLLLLAAVPSRTAGATRSAQLQWDKQRNQRQAEIAEAIAAESPLAHAAATSIQCESAHD
jgi:hypothetical protein